MSSLDSDRVSSSDDCSSEDSTSSSSTGSSSPRSPPGQVPNPQVPEPQPVNQVPDQVFMGRDEPVDDESGPYDPDNETRDAWEERLRTAGYFPLPTFYVLDIPSHVSKIALNKVCRRLPDGYVLQHEHDWPNIVEPHQENRIGFHIVSLDGGIVFPLRPLLTEVCHAFRILPGQLTPNAHRYLHSFVNICSHLKIEPSLRLFLFCFEVLPGGTGCEGFVFFKGQNGRKFISDVSQSNRGWKEKFVFIEFPPFVTPLAGLKWNDHLLNNEYTVLASSPDLEASLEILLRGDPFTGRKFHYGSWVWRVEAGGEGTSQAHEAAGRGTWCSRNLTFPRTSQRERPVVLKLLLPKLSRSNQRPWKYMMRTSLKTIGPRGRAKIRPVAGPKEVATIHPSFGKKRQRADPDAASQSVEEAFINLGLRLREAGEIGPLTADRLGMSSPFEVDRLKKEKEEMALILKSQVDELIRLSGLAGAMKTEISQLKEENGRLMDEVSEVKKEVAEKEENFRGLEAAWVEENKAEAARVMTVTPEATMESFRLLYQEPEGRKMITAIGYILLLTGSGQKKDQIASHRILLKRDPDFTAASYGLALIPEEEPSPPFPPAATGHLL
ncbi:unnamed protein product [Cuscuta campestris]|uniref:Transposase (putative) gypsy type domain-containing protein n=1 Tax=Cuscuta campestris TaxID=132261 RepID=A0A484N2X2_9ASTE|nr:unnamed protein product [Cuscuta campestris]